MFLSVRGTRGVSEWIRGMRLVFGNDGIDVEFFEVCEILVPL